MKSTFVKSATRLQSLAAALTLASLLALTSCGDDNGSGPVLSAPEHNEAGWQSYILGDFADAREHFAEALALDDGLVEALLGLAWCDAQLGDYASSVERFDEIVDSGEHVTDAFAGRAAAALEMPDFGLAVASADSALERNPQYSFSRQPGYDYGDLRLILAQSYFALGLYGSAQGQVDIISPGNGLDPADAQSWVVGETVYPTYEAALAMLIETLWAIESAGA